MQNVSGTKSKRTSENASNKKLLEYKLFHFLSYRSKLGWIVIFIDIDRISVTETFEETVPISESYPRDSKRKKDDQSTLEAFLL